MTLALLITAVGGAWAQTALNVAELTIPDTWQNDDTYLSTNDLPGYQVATRDNAVAWTGAPEGYAMLFFDVTSSAIKTATFHNGNCTTDGSSSGLKHSTLYTWKNSASYRFFYTTAPAEPDVKVTINDAKTEASFTMPAYDATADYELVRDMSVQMTAQVGDGTQEQPRYRVKKDGNKFIPADMEMAAVPALFTVNDAIEQKALTQTQDYIVQIYAIDAEGQPTGEAMTFATFTFEPGIYAVKAVAAQGSDYDGETALSNTFTLAEAYDLTLSPATNANLKSVTVGGTAKTADEKGVIKNIEPGKKVKITTTGPDYIIRKATVKKTVKLQSITISGVTVYYAEGESWADAIKRDENKDLGLFIREGNRVHHPDLGQLVDSNTQPVLPDAKINANESYKFIH